MEYTEHYDNMEERNALCSVAASNGFRLIYDTFDEDWRKGDEPHGTLTFTDVMPPAGEPTRDLWGEIDEMKFKMVVSEPPGGMTKIRNIYKDPETDEMVGENEDG